MAWFVSNLFLKIKRETAKFLAGVRLKSVTSNYMGMELKVPVVHGVVERGHITPGEFWMGDCLKVFIDTKEGAVVDIGVNVGLFLIKLRVLSRGRPYIGFEPNPSCLLYTQELIRLNVFENSSLFPLALFDSEGVARFFASKPGDKTGSLMPEFKSGDARNFSFDVLTVIGDRIIDTIGLQQLSVIKVDVEEAELHVLRGLSGTISQFRPYIYCEILHPEGDSKRQQKGLDVYTFIVSKGYKVLGLQRETNELRIIDDFADIEIAFKEEFVFCPDELLESFRGSIKNNSSGVRFP